MENTTERQYPAAASTVHLPEGQWERILGESIKASRARLSLLLNEYKIERQSTEPYSIKENGAERKGSRLLLHIPDYPERVQKRLEGRKVKITKESVAGEGYRENSQEKKKPASAAISSVETKVVNIKPGSDGVSADVVLDLEGKRFHVGDSKDTGPSNLIKIEALRKESPRKLKRQLDLVTRFERGENLTAPGKVYKSGKFPVPSSEGLEVKEGLDPAQNRAYGLAMAYDKCPILFIHGGPGTGKTETICNIVKGHAEKGRRVLVVSHSNKGSQVPAMRLKEYGLDIHIAGNDPESVDKEVRGDRIRQGVSYPKDRIQEIRQMKPDKILQDHMTEEEAMVPERLRFDGDPEKYLRDKIEERREQMIQKILAKYESKLMEREKRFKRSMQKKKGVAFSTIDTLLNDKILLSKNPDGSPYFDVVIVDEATRLHTPDLVLALQSAGKQVIFVGDPEQLGTIPIPPQEKKSLTAAMTNDDKESAEYGSSEAIAQTRQKLRSCMYPHAANAIHAIDTLEKGTFSSAIFANDEPEKVLPYVFLNVCRRSLPAIVRVVSPLVYKGKLLPGREPDPVLGDGIVELFDTSKLAQTEKSSGTSRTNPVEVGVINRDVMEAVFRYREDPKGIGVISTYKGQSNATKKRFSKFTTIRNSPELLACVAANNNTVDAFQGDERDSIEVSLTRSNEHGDIGFVAEKKRIAVAIERARDRLTVVGDMSTLIENNNDPVSQAFFRQLRDLIAENGKVITLPPLPYGKGIRRRKRGRGRTRREKRLHREAMQAKLSAYKSQAPAPTVVSTSRPQESRLVEVAPGFDIQSDLMGEDES